MLASGAFIALFIWGWDLPVSEALQFALLLIMGLVLLLGFAAALGWVFAWVSSRRALDSVDTPESLPSSSPSSVQSEPGDGLSEDSRRV